MVVRYSIVKGGGWQLGFTVGLEGDAAFVSRKRYLDGFLIISVLHFSHEVAETNLITRLPFRRYVVVLGGPDGGG